MIYEREKSFLLRDDINYSLTRAILLREKGFYDKINKEAVDLGDIYKLKVVRNCRVDLKISDAS